MAIITSLYTSGFKSLEFILKIIIPNLYSVLSTNVMVYDVVLPVSPVLVGTPFFHNHKWGFPNNYVIQKHYSGVTVAIATDTVGNIKIYECNSSGTAILVETGWGATVTQEGSIIYHGPSNDVRSEICILCPLGYDVDTDAGTGHDVIAKQIAAVPVEENWILDESNSAQFYYLMYEDTENYVCLITQEISYTTDTKQPVVKTIYHDEDVRRYDLKAHSTYWHQAGQAMTDVQDYIPDLSKLSKTQALVNTRSVIEKLTELKALYVSASGKFDAFRNPELVP